MIPKVIIQHVLLKLKVKRSLISVFQSQPTLRQNRKGIVELRIIFSIMSLLGLTWVFGILQISYQHIVIQYMFALSNTLQVRSCYAHAQSDALSIENHIIYYYIALSGL